MLKSAKTIVPISEIPIALDVPIHIDNLIEVFKIITQMEHLCIAEKGIGLSAVQIGIPWKLFIIQRNSEFEYYINCEYTGIGVKSKSIEGCLSIKNKQGNIRRFEVDRYGIISVKGKRLKIVESSLILEDVDQIECDLYAVVFQHEIDHQNNILISDIGIEIEFLG